MINVKNNIWGGFVSKDNSTIMRSDPTYLQNCSNAKKKNSNSIKAMK